jgi:hypothetical protein
LSPNGLVGRGLRGPPEPSPGDVYLDLEGDPSADDGREREHLAGLWGRSSTFTSWWAHHAAAEKQLVEHLIGHIMRQDRLGVSQPTADNAIRQLKDVGIVDKASGIQRYIVYIAPDVITALDEFAGRARRGRPS